MSVKYGHTMLKWQCLLYTEVINYISVGLSEHWLRVDTHRRVTTLLSHFNDNSLELCIDLIWKWLVYQMPTTCLHWISIHIGYALDNRWKYLTWDMTNLIKQNPIYNKYREFDQTKYFVKQVSWIWPNKILRITSIVNLTKQNTSYNKYREFDQTKYFI